MKKFTGFTLAEAIITIVIIGIVATLTIPSVLKNYNDRKYNAARLKALKTFGEAGKMLSFSGEISKPGNARDFANNVLAKYLKITRVCDNAQKCNFPTQIQPSDTNANKLNSDTYNHYLYLNRYNWSTKSSMNHLYLTTADGFSAKLFYNPNCAKDSKEAFYMNAETSCTSKDCASLYIDDICLNVIYDMNGAKGPNHVGEDIGIVTTFWSGFGTTSTAPRILPHSFNPNPPNKTYAQALDYCSSLSTDKINSRLPNIDELTSVYANAVLTSIPVQGGFWSSTVVSSKPNNAWYVYYWRGAQNYGSQNLSYKVFCIRG